MGGIYILISVVAGFAIAALYNYLESDQIIRLTATDNEGGRYVYIKCREILSIRHILTPAIPEYKLSPYTVIHGTKTYLAVKETPQEIVNLPGMRRFKNASHC